MLISQSLRYASLFLLIFLPHVYFAQLFDRDKNPVDLTTFRNTTCFFIFPEINCSSCLSSTGTAIEKIKKYADVYLVFPAENLSNATAREWIVTSKLKYPDKHLYLIANADGNYAFKSNTSVEVISKFSSGEVLIVRSGDGLLLVIESAKLFDDDLNISKDVIRLVKSAGK